MYVLGIETSCDETAAAVVKDGRKVLSSEVASSLKFHKKYGGIIPEIAFRMQLETIAEVADSAIKEAGIKLGQVGLISVTCGPGLLGSLLVGLSFAKSLSMSLDIPLLGVNHLHSHIYANFLNGAPSARLPALPFLALVVSGGHTSLLQVDDFDDIKILGQSYDDACGEAFDKVARILGLGYPGGPLIEKIARTGNPKAVKFGCSDTKNPLDFSFSGIKTAVLYHVCRFAGLPVSRLNRMTKDVAASFQDAVIEALVRKSLAACRGKKINRLLLGGGVVVNNSLRERLAEEAKRNKISVYFPPPELCLDNAAMVAGFGYALFKKGKVSDLYLNAQPS